MGVRAKCLRYINEITEIAEINFTEINFIYDLNCCILGSTQLRDCARKMIFQNHGDVAKKLWLLKDFFIYMQWNVIDIDKNYKKADYQIDLCQPVPSELLDRFDLIIDAGTGEHILDQKSLYRNKHGMLKKNGVSISIVPVEGSYFGHGSWQYPVGFPLSLCHENKYGFIDVRVTSNRYRYFVKDRMLLYFAYKKMLEKPFSSNFPKLISDKQGRKMDLKKY